jgi:transposase-like protein
MMRVEKIKQQIIHEYLSGDISLRKLAYKYDYDHNVIYKWIMAYQRFKRMERVPNPGAAVKKPLPEAVPMPADAPMSTDVKLLQEELRLSQIRVLLLEATIDIADERFGTDMRKKVGARQS